MYRGRQAIGDDLISGVIKNAGGGGTGVLHLAPQPGDGWAPGTAAFDERLVLLRPGLIVIKPRLRHVVTCQFRDRSAGSPGERGWKRPGGVAAHRRCRQGSEGSVVDLL